MDGDDTIRITLEASSIVRYFCDRVLQENQELESQKLYAPYAYELRYDCSSPESMHSAEDGMEVMEESMLVKLKNQFLYNASVCVAAPPPTRDPFTTTLWIGALDSRPRDSQFSGGSCTHTTALSSDDTCCIVVQGNMSFTNLTSVSSGDIVLSAARDALIASNGTAGYSLYYLGAEVIDITPSENTATSNNKTGLAETVGDEMVLTNQDHSPQTTLGGSSSSRIDDYDDVPNVTVVLLSFAIAILALSLCAAVAYIIALQKRRRNFALNKLWDNCSNNGNGEFQQQDGGKVENNTTAEDEIVERCGKIEPRRLPTVEFPKRFLQDHAAWGMDEYERHFLPVTTTETTTAAFEGRTIPVVSARRRPHDLDYDEYERHFLTPVTTATTPSFATSIIPVVPTATTHRRPHDLDSSSDDVATRDLEHCGWISRTAEDTVGSYLDDHQGSSSSSPRRYDLVQHRLPVRTLK